MRSRTIAVALCLVLTRIASAQGSRGSGACAIRRIDPEPCLLNLARGAGSIRLPPLTTVTPLGKNPDGRHLVLEDSTDLEVWVTEYPADGLAASGPGPTRADSMSRRDTTVAGRPATF